MIPALIFRAIGCSPSIFITVRTEINLVFYGVRIADRAYRRAKFWTEFARQMLRESNNVRLGLYAGQLGAS